MDRRQAIQRAAVVLGYSISAPAIMGILKGCKATPEIGYKPVFFNPDQAAVMAEVAEIIIPKTETPGAKETGVPAFMDLMLKDCYGPEDQKRFLEGVTALDAEAEKSFGNGFMDCSPEQQKELVQRIHSEAIASVRSQNPPKERPFILMAKELTMLGFFTSEAGATQVLNYVPVPGSYQGCVQVGTTINGVEVGRTWAL
ncbi:MAG: gluconate 2-dehydrogenase subunit 3 family protein [Cyclobacteriaceae bacterium]